jgi:hypothetical protein
MVRIIRAKGLLPFGLLSLVSAQTASCLGSEGVELIQALAVPTSIKAIYKARLAIQFILK